MRKALISACITAISMSWSSIDDGNYIFFRFLDTRLTRSDVWVREWFSVFIRAVVQVLKSVCLGLAAIFLASLHVPEN